MSLSIDSTLLLFHCIHVLVLSSNQVQFAAPGRVDSYLAGLLWNLQTYQDGVCADYAYNYGRRMSPTANEIVDFFKDAMKENRTVGRDELLGDTFTSAVSAEISCLAALPSEMQELIPEPYNRLSNTTVEELYASCMDPEDNRFDMKQFEMICQQRVRETASEEAIDLNADPEIHKEKYGRHGRRILTGDHYWIVLSRQKSPLTHPFDPPAPFSDRLSELRPNRLMKASRTMVTAEPRPRSVWSTTNSTEDHTQARDRRRHIAKHESREVKHADTGNLLKTPDGGELSILDVDYKRAYPNFQRRRNKKKGPQFQIARISGELPTKNGKKPKQHRRDFDVAARMREHNLAVPPSETLTNTEGFSPLLLLNQLSDANLIGEVRWNYIRPSTSLYASVDPLAHELVQLTVGKGTKKSKSALFEDLSYEQDRDVNSMSRQSLKHHLSSLALCDILGPKKRWTELSFKELKSYLSQRTTQQWQSNKS